MPDDTEAYRRQRQAEINRDQADRHALEAQYGQVWDTTELSADFSVTGFAAPYVVVTRRADGQVGSLEFQHRPRFYFNFVPDRGA
jgi:hypothetical protein